MRRKFSIEQLLDEDIGIDDNDEDSFVVAVFAFGNMWIWQQQCFKLQKQFYEE